METLRLGTILVVDDCGRFPLHVWRYLSRRLGFGIGEVKSDGRRSPKEDSWISAGEPIEVDGTALQLYWVKANGDWQERLNHLFFRGRRIPYPVHALVDVNGQFGTEYHAEKVCEYLDRETPHGVAVTWWLVSSYHASRRIVARATKACRGQSMATWPRSAPLRSILGAVSGDDSSILPSP